MSRSLRTDRRFRANRVVRKFRRWCDSGQYTGLFEDLSVALRDGLRSRVHLKNEEIPLLGSFTNDLNWALLTADRLVVTDAGKTREVPWEDIKGVVLDEELVSQLGNEFKKKIDKIRVETTTGSLQLTLEPGFPCLGFWTIIEMLSEIGTSE